MDYRIWKGTGKPFTMRYQNRNKMEKLTLFIDNKKIRQIPTDRRVTYENIFVDYRPQKTDPNCVRITPGGNIINYPG